MSIRIAAGPRRIAPQLIESELAKLWISLPRVGGATPSMRAVMTNLVAVGSSAGETNAAMEVIGNIVGRNPCRVILVTSEPDRDPPELNAEVAVICQDSETCERCACCDRISLAARGIMADNLPSLVTTLLAPDLPVVLWWTKPPFDRKDFGLFVQHVDRVIVDSAGYTDDDLRALSRFVEQSRHMGVAVSDLNWARLAPYRQLFAKFFDSMECRDHLAAIQEVRVEGNASTGRLLAGWLKAQIEKTGCALSHDRIRLISTGTTGFSFKSLVMTCSESCNTFAVNRTEDCTLETRAKVDAKEWNNVIKSKCPGLDKLLIDEIAYSKRDSVFESALAAAVLL